MQCKICNRILQKFITCNVCGNAVKKKPHSNNCINCHQGKLRLTYFCEHCQKWYGN